MAPPGQQLTDTQLLDQTRAGDMSAFDELYRRHVADARRVARIVTDDGEEAEGVVAEAFGRVLAKLRQGGGPEGVLTPYLRTVIRRLAVDRHRKSSREDHPADPAMLNELPTADDEIAPVTDRQLIRAAFESLPERWQRVLWHSEIEGRPPAALTPALGSSPNAVAALAYRAGEGLRQAFLAAHLTASAPPSCRPYLPKLAAYIRQTLPQEEDVAVAIHLDTCAHCRERRDELLLLVSDLRGVLVPALLGTLKAGGSLAAAGLGGVTALAGATAATQAAARAGSTGAGMVDDPEAIGAVSRLRPRGFVQIAATSVVSAAAAAAVAFAAISAISQTTGTDEPAAAPPPMTSALQPATIGKPSVADIPSLDSNETPTETPSPTEEPTEGEDITQAEASSPNAESPGANQAQSSNDGGAGGKSSQSSNSQGSPDSKPKRDSDAKPEPPAPGSNDEPGNKNPGTPPASPWACDVVPLLPWCN